jgi:hypothetical protein
MTTLLPLLPILFCVGMMFGAGALLWFANKTPLRRVPWIARRAKRSAAHQQADSRA